MKIISEAESAGIKLIIAVLAIELIVVAFFRTKNNDYTIQPINGDFDTVIVHDTVWQHDTIVDVHPITKTIHDTIFITQ